MTIDRVMEDLISLWGPQCSKCIAQRFCGMCPDVVWDKSEIPNSQLFKSSCGFIRRAFLHDLQIFVELAETNARFIPHLEGVVVS